MGCEKCGPDEPFLSDWELDLKELGAELREVLQEKLVSMHVRVQKLEAQVRELNLRLELLE